MPLEALQTDIGPLPLWGWLAAGAAGVGVGVALRRRSGAGVEETRAPVGSVGTPVSLIQGAAPVATGDAAPLTNLKWRSQALDSLVEAGVAPTTADEVISRYLVGDDLDAEERLLVDDALLQHGLPPAPPRITPSASPPADLGGVPGNVSRPVEAPVRPVVVERAPPKVDPLTADVTAAYREILKRNPDPGGLAYWRSQLAQGRLTSDGLRAELAASAEARRRNLA